MLWNECKAEVVPPRPPPPVLRKQIYLCYPNKSSTVGDDVAMGQHGSLWVSCEEKNN